jgi:hypothetical protein
VHVHCDDYNIEDSESPSNASHDIQYLWFWIQVTLLGEG